VWLHCLMGVIMIARLLASTGMKGGGFKRCAIPSLDGVPRDSVKGSG
jgi:hypothetical protein